MENHPERPSVSVVLASYNGEKYLEQQMRSVLDQLSETDELLVTDDGSSDGTVSVEEKLASQYTQIRLIRGEHLGPTGNFRRGIRAAKGQVIFLCDQDDIWLPGKVDQVLAVFEGKTGPPRRQCPLLCMHDAVFINEAGQPSSQMLFSWRKPSRSIAGNWWKNRFTGCCMAFDRGLQALVCDMPADIPMYDQWIGLMALTYGQVVYLPDVMLQYRRHGANATSLHHQSLPRMIRDRLVLLRRYFLKKAQMKKRSEGGYDS